MDNVSVNGVAVSLDIETGKLGEYEMKMDSTVEHFFEHPGSHLRIKDTCRSYVRNSMDRGKKNR